MYPTKDKFKEILTTRVATWFDKENQEKYSFLSPLDRMHYPFITKELESGVKVREMKEVVCAKTPPLALTKDGLLNFHD